MEIRINDKIINFQIIPLTFVSNDISSVYYTKNNKTLSQTFDHHKYSRLKLLLADKYTEHHNRRLGDFLKSLNELNDKNYISFLNKYGDNKFCEFKITDNLNDKGVYCYIVDSKIKYVGRCTDNFKKRINQGYGKIHAKNCFIDGQATNCRVNSLLNSSDNVQLGVYVMTDKTTEEIKELEKLILKFDTYEWNIQTS